MRMRIPPALPFKFLISWAFACIFAFLFSSASGIFEFAYFVLPFSAFIVPLCFSHISCRFVHGDERATLESRSSIALSAAAALIGIAAYGLSVAVFGRFLELTWRTAKFGQTSLDLGKSAAQFYSLVAFLTALAAFALLRVAPVNSRHARYASGSLGMLISASLIYLVFGLSPLVQWRE